VRFSMPAAFLVVSLVVTGITFAQGASPAPSEGRSDATLSPDDQAASSSTAEADYAPLYQGDPAPDFSEPDIFGKGTVALKSFRGELVVLNFWATWCAPCLQEIPALEKLAKAYPGRVAVIGASVFCSNSDTERFYRQYGINYPMFYGSWDLIGKYDKVSAIPTTFVIDRQGRVVARIVGSRSLVEYETILAPLL